MRLPRPRLGDGGVVVVVAAGEAVGDADEGDAVPERTRLACVVPGITALCGRARAIEELESEACSNMDATARTERLRDDDVPSVPLLLPSVDDVAGSDPGVVPARGGAAVAAGSLTLGERNCTTVTPGVTVVVVVTVVVLVAVRTGDAVPASLLAVLGLGLLVMVDDVVLMVEEDEPSALLDAPRPPPDLLSKFVPEPELEPDMGLLSDELLDVGDLERAPGDGVAAAAFNVLEAFGDDDLITEGLELAPENRLAMVAVLAVVGVGDGTVMPEADMPVAVADER
jgi:hypothetical protein